MIFDPLQIYCSVLKGFEIFLFFYLARIQVKIIKKNTIKNITQNLEKPNANRENRGGSIYPIRYRNILNIILLIIFIAKVVQYFLDISFNLIAAVSIPVNYTNFSGYPVIVKGYHTQFLSLTISNLIRDIEFVFFAIELFFLYLFGEILKSCIKFLYKKPLIYIVIFINLITIYFTWKYEFIAVTIRGFNDIIVDPLWDVSNAAIMLAVSLFGYSILYGILTFKLYYILRNDLQIVPKVLKTKFEMVIIGLFLIVVGYIYFILKIYLAFINSLYVFHTIGHTIFIIAALILIAAFKWHNKELNMEIESLIKKDMATAHNFDGIRIF
ncbi:MAG: hypothetical protein ACTSU2_15185 [Promethearchaeota archaeon]